MAKGVNATVNPSKTATLRRSRLPMLLSTVVMLALLLAACLTEPEDTTPPVLTSSTPASGATDVPLSQPLTLHFSKAMDPESLVVTTDPAVALEDPVWTNPATARIDPVTTWTAGATQQVHVVAKDAAGNALTGGGTVSFTVVTPPDTTAPAAPTGLVAVSGDGGFDLSWTANTESDLLGYTAYFGEDLEVPDGAIFVAAPGHEVSVTGLTNGTTYNYYVIAEDTSGNRSEPSEVGSVVPQDQLAPALLASAPQDGAVDLGAVVQVRLTFSEPLNTATFEVEWCEKTAIGAPSCSGATTALAAPTWSEGDSVVTYATSTTFSGGKAFALFPTGSDVAGNPLPAGLSISFALAVVPDEEPPTVTAYTQSVDPVDDVRRLLRFTFSEEMDWNSVRSAFLSTPAISCSWTFDGTVATCRTGRLKEFTNYQFTISNSAKDVAGNQLAAPYAAPQLAIGDLRPYLVSATPSGIDLEASTVHIVLTFSERIALGSIAGKMLVTVGGSPRAYTEEAELDGARWRYTPAPTWGNGVTVIWSLPSVQDFTGNNSSTSFTGSFVTRPIAGSLGSEAAPAEEEADAHD